MPLRNSKIIAISLFITTFISVVFFLFFLHSKELSNFPPNFLSTEYVKFETSKANHQIVQDLQAKLIDDPFTLLRSSNDDFMGVYTNDVNFSPNIIEGRNFSNEDFSKNRNVIIISEKINTFTEHLNDKKIYYYKNIPFEVIGVYRESSNRVHSSSTGYYNLLASEVKNKSDLSNDFNTIFNLDSHSTNFKVKIQNFLNELNIKPLQREIDIDPLTALNKYFSSYGLSLNLFLSIVAISFVTLLMSVLSWINSRKRELYVRTLVGSTKKKNLFLLFKDYLLLQSLISLCLLLLIVLTVNINSLSISIYIYIDILILPSIIIVFFSLICIFIKFQSLE